MKSDGSFSIGSRTWPGAGKLIEEMGELTTILGKLIATHGETEYWEDVDLAERLEEEVADVRAALGFFVEHNLDELNAFEIAGRQGVKQVQYNRWHNEHSRPRPSKPSTG